MPCGFVFTAHCSDIVRDKSTLRPHLAHAGVDVTWAKRGQDSGKVWAGLGQSVGNTRAMHGHGVDRAWTSRGLSVQDMQSASMSKRNRRARKECEVKYASKEPDERGATKGARNPLKRR